MYYTDTQNSTELCFLTSARLSAGPAGANSSVKPSRDFLIFKNLWNFLLLLGILHLSATCTGFRTGVSRKNNSNMNTRYDQLDRAQFRSGRAPALLPETPGFTFSISTRTTKHRHLEETEGTAEVAQGSRRCMKISDLGTRKRVRRRRMEQLTVVIKDLSVADRADIGQRYSIK